jgi:hypothetical protein
LEEERVSAEEEWLTEQRKQATEKQLDEEKIADDKTLTN